MTCVTYIGKNERRGNHRPWNLWQIDSRGAFGRDYGAPGNRAGQRFLAARPCRNISRSVGGCPREACRGREMDHDGDLGPYDAVEIRLRAVDTILFLDFSLVRCGWRAICRSPEHADFWRWLMAYRWQSRPILMEAIANDAVQADLHVFRYPRALKRFVAGVACAIQPG
jgi:hypothetical protein